MRNGMVCVLVMAAVAMIAGCQSTGYTQSGFAGSNIRTVAIAPVSGPACDDCTREAVADIFASDLCAKGYKVTSTAGGPVFEPSALNAPNNPVGVASPSATDTLENTTKSAAPSTAPCYADATMHITVARWDQGMAFDADIVDNRTGAVAWRGGGSDNVAKLWAQASACRETYAVGTVESCPTGAMAVGVGPSTCLSAENDYAAKQIIARMLNSLPGPGQSTTYR